MKYKIEMIVEALRDFDSAGGPEASQKEIEMEIETCLESIYVKVPSLAITPLTETQPNGKTQETPPDKSNRVGDSTTATGTAQA